MKEPLQESDALPHAGVEPWVSEPQYRQGVVDLLGILAYGALAAFDRLAEDARRAPTLGEKVYVASLAALQINHFDTVRDRLGGLDVDVMAAMKPFHAPFDEFHAQTQPKGWLEGLVLAYVGNGFAADFYREIAAFVEGTVVIALVAVGVLFFFAVLTFVARRVLRLPPATRYWWIGAGAGAIVRACTG